METLNWITLDRDLIWFLGKYAAHQRGLATFKKELFKMVGTKLLLIQRDFRTTSGNHFDVKGQGGMDWISILFIEQNGAILSANWEGSFERHAKEVSLVDDRP